MTMSVTKLTTTRSLVVIGMIMLEAFQLSQGQQWTRRKRVSPVLAIEDLNPLSVLEQDEYSIMDRNLGIGGYHSPNYSIKSNKSSKSGKEHKSTKKHKSSKHYRLDDGFDFFSMETSMSMSMRPPPTPTPPVPTPTLPVPSPTSPSTTEPVPDPSSPPQSLPTDDPQPLPTDAPPVTDPTDSPGGDCASQPRAEAMIDTLSAVTDSATLTNPSTPQGMAYQWLLDTDPAQIDPCTYPTLKQRYALTTMYYSTNGDDWTETSGWLTGANECMWFGVSCNSDLVSEITLGTFYCA
jgi:hypothetical protein